MKKITSEFFLRKPDVIAKMLLGKILVFGSKRARIVETEAYFDSKDPASRASKGENKVHKMMKEEEGRILVYNVHMYKMLNFVCGKKGKAGAILIRAIEPLNFKGRCNGPGLLTDSLGIKDKHHGQRLGEEINLFEDFYSVDSKDLGTSNRIGVTKDLKKPYRFFIKGNKFVSK